MRGIVLSFFILAVGMPVYAAACPPDEITRFGMSPSPAVTAAIQAACVLKPNTCGYANTSACHKAIDDEVRAEKLLLPNRARPQ